MTISLPAGRPPWAAVRVIRKAVTDAWAAGGPVFRLPVLVESTSSVPQSSSEVVVPGVDEMSRPSARRPCTLDSEVSAPAERTLAPAVAEAVTLPATISPLKSETTMSSPYDSAVAAAPGAAKRASRERPMLTTEPSAG